MDVKTDVKTDIKTDIKTGIKTLYNSDAAFPARLLDIPDAPKQLYVLGKIPREDVPSVAVIGARDCTEYGKFVAAELGRILGKEGVQVISGMARGIDGIAQSAALKAGGESYAVLGCGVDVCYPVSNRTLYEELIQKGGVLSEYKPGTPAMSRLFPPRNRIVSGLADVVVVVEAGLKSGTLITVDMALEQGKEVFVVPGRITDRLSEGCNRLAKLGAGMITNGREFVDEVWNIYMRNKRNLENKPRQIELLDIMPNYLEQSQRAEEEEMRLADGKTDGERNKKPKLSEEQSRIYASLDFEPRSVEQIRGMLGEEFTDKQIITHLIYLCMENLAIQVSPSQFCVKKC